MLEAVVNVSEGQRADVLAQLAAACGPALLDLHADADHHRSVFTLARSGRGTLDAALWLTSEATRTLDVSDHEGVHPRLGAVDVVPFVALDGSTDADAVVAARSYGNTVAGEHGVPVFFYDLADPEARSLPSVRAEAFRLRPPDHGPPRPHPTLGAIAVGARRLLVAVNCELATDDVAVARQIATVVRERDGGLPGVRALGFLLAARGRAQVSMNLVDLAATGIEAAVTAVRDEARRRGSEVAAVELVGLLPAVELQRCSTGFRKWAGLGPELTIEARIAAGQVLPSPDH